MWISRPNRYILQEHARVCKTYSDAKMTTERTADAVTSEVNLQPHQPGER